MKAGFKIRFDLFFAVATERALTVKECESLLALAAESHSVAMVKTPDGRCDHPLIDFWVDLCQRHRDDSNSPAGKNFVLIFKELSLHVVNLFRTF